MSRGPRRVRGGFEKGIGLTEADVWWNLPLRLQLESTRLNRPYEQSVWPYVAVSSWARNLAKVPFKLFRGTRDAPQEVTAHPVLELLRSPNPYMTGELLNTAVAVSLGLDGEFFLVKESGRESALRPGEVPKELWPIPPACMRHDVDPRTKLVRMWVQEVNGRTTQYFPHEVVHGRLYNPYDFYRGLSPLRAAALGLTSDWLSGQYDAAFWRNSADPGGILSTDQFLSPEQADRHRERFEQRHRGVGRAGRIAVLAQGLKYQSLSVNRKEMQFLEGKRWTMLQALAIWGVPPIEAGLYHEQGLGQQSALVQRRVYWENVLLPLLALFVGALNGRGVLGAVSGLEGHWLAGDTSGISVLQEDLDAKAGTLEKLVRSGVPLNEAAKLLRLGLPAIDGGDVGYMPAGMVPLAMLAEGVGMPALPTAAPDGQDAPAARAVQIPSRAVLPRALPAGEAVVEKVHRQVFRPQERAWASKMSRYFHDLRREVLRKFDDLTAERAAKAALTSSEVEQLIEGARQRWNRELERRARPLYEAVVRAAAAVTENELGGYENFLGAQDPAVLEFVSRRLPKLAGDVNGTLAEGVREQLIAGIAQNETVAELRDRIRDVFNVAGSRATTIARTETGIGVNGTRFAAFKAEGVQKHRWSTAGDAEVRESHRVLHGEVRAIGEAFSNGLLYPNDPAGDPAAVVNCRCTALPVVE